MGLDCYVQFDSSDDETIQIWYGRKENEIHGWMQRHSGMEAGDFNCEKLFLIPELLSEFEEAIKALKEGRLIVAGELETYTNNDLVPTSGFFFGSPGDPVEVAETAIKLLEAARQAIADGHKPYYFSWW